MSKTITIYTDGSCNNTGDKRGGWGAVMIFNGQEIKLSGREDNTTNNRMEMKGILDALKRLTKSKLKVDEVLIYSDSKYAISIFDGTNRASKNRDLLQEFHNYKLALIERGTQIRFQWVKGHAGDKYNEMADQLANCNTIITSEVKCPVTTTSITPSS